MRKILIAVAAVAALVVAGSGLSSRSVAPVGPPISTGTGGAVATVERLATQAATDVLKKGGNAVDAAVTAAAVLGVTEPFSCGIGGGGFMVIYRANQKYPKHPHVFTLDSRETAPRAMTATSFMQNGVALPFADARYSGLSVGVPGTVRGWEEALRKFGTMKLADVLAPAIRIATNGFEIDQTFFNQVNDNRDYFDDVPATASLYLDPDGTPRDVGTVLRNPDLAKTYQLLAQRGPNAFYTGALADAIVQTVTRPPIAPNANHVWRPGVMTTADLAAYKALQRAPTRVTYRGLHVFGMGPPSSGGSTVGEALNILEGYNLGALPREQALHYFLEASRFAFADRGAYLADPDFVRVPLKTLLSDEFAASRRALITERAATSPVPAAPAGSTTHITTADAKGNVVSYTFTIEATGGSGLTVPGYGFLLNNELTDFDFGSTTAANRVEGGKRPRSSMAPTIVLQRGKPILALGSPGGSTIITTILQILVDRLDLRATLPQALANPRASQRNTASVSAEAEFLAAGETTGLRARGHTFAAPAEIGAATAIEFSGGTMLAAAEPVRRGGGSAMVVKPG